MEIAVATQNRLDDKKTLIGVLASHDDQFRNSELVNLFGYLWKDYRDILKKFHFVFTGGTFGRVIKLLGDKSVDKKLNLTDTEIEGIQTHITENSTYIPGREYGGVTMMANLIVQRQCSILWPFLGPSTTHWLYPENLALLRLCDVSNVKRFMNSGSVRNWFHYEAERDYLRNQQEIPLKFHFGADGFDPLPAERSRVRAAQIKKLVDTEWYDQWSEEKDFKEAHEENKTHYYCIQNPLPKKRQDGFWLNFGNQTIALIAHDGMKERMINFAIEYETELSNFGRILSTGNTGREVEAATRKLKVKRCRSGPWGGDIEIATEILFGRCDVVIFFIDPLHPHPHIDDIRVVFAACMIENEVLMLTNEVQAREWMDVVVRPRVT